MEQDDMKIITRLRDDSRMSLANLGKDMGKGVVEIMDRMEDLEKEHLKGYTVLLNHPSLGYHCMAVLVKLDGDKNHFLDYLKNHVNVNNISTLAGPYDILFETVHESAQRANEFLSGLKESFGIARIDVLPQLNMVARERHRF